MYQLLNKYGREMGGLSLNMTHYYVAGYLMVLKIKRYLDVLRNQLIWCCN